MPDVQSPLLGVVHLVGRYAALPAAAEVQSDVFGIYWAHAVAKFRACEYAPMPDAINFQLFWPLYCVPFSPWVLFLGES